MISRAAPSSCARARTNAIVAPGSLRALAGALLEGRPQAQAGSDAELLIPRAIELRKVLQEEPATEPGRASDFIHRARLIRQAIAKELPGFPADSVDKIPFEISTPGRGAVGSVKPGPIAWYLGPAVGADRDRARQAVMADDAHARVYVRLALLKAIAERAALEATDIVLHPGFGSSIYFGPRTGSGVLKLAEIDFMVREIAGSVQILALVRSKAFVRKRHTASAAQATSASGALPAGSVQLIGVGDAASTSVARLNPADFYEADARRYHLPGITLNRGRFRQTRLYYLNLATELAAEVLAQAGVEHSPEIFQATHLVDGGFVEPPAVAQFAQDISLLSPTPESDSGARPDSRGPGVGADAVDRLGLVLEVLASLGPLKVGTRSTAMSLPALLVPDEAPGPGDLVPTDVSHLVFNGAEAELEGASGPAGSGSDGDDDDDDSDGGSTVRIRERRPAGDPRGPAPWALVPAARAYELLCTGAGGAEVEADLYTRLKYELLHDRSTVEHVLQGIDASLADLAQLAPGAAGADPNFALPAKLKRCLVEISLKEALVGRKDLWLPGVSPAACGGAGGSMELELIATRCMRVGSHKSDVQVRRLVSVVDARLEFEPPDGAHLRITGNRRSAWSRSGVDEILFCGQYPFLQAPDSGPIRDGQFWVVDRASGHRLVAWSGNFVPKVVLNERYSGIEAALALQDDALDAKAGGGKTYSKSAEINLLPYYMSMLATPARGEAPARKIAIQDRGSFLRVFVPPAGGLEGPSKNAMSCMRDVMIYDSDGRAIDVGLIDHPLARLYVHTMTAGILVAGGNSKMSLLEKFARLPIEN